jgi:hypothetical protein
VKVFPCFLLAALFVATFALPARAAKPCEAIEFEGRVVKVGVTGIDCQGGRERVEAFYELWDPAKGYYPVQVEGFLCSTASAGTDVRCRSGERWIFATARPYEDITKYHPPPPPKPRQSYWRDCGQPAPYALQTVIAHRVNCVKARRLIRMVWRRGQQPTPVSVLRVKSFECTLGSGARPISCTRGPHTVRGPLPG